MRGGPALWRRREEGGEKMLTQVDADRVSDTIKCYNLPLPQTPNKHDWCLPGDWCGWCIYLTSSEPSAYTRPLQHTSSHDHPHQTLVLIAHLSSQLVPSHPMAGSSSSPTFSSPSLSSPSSSSSSSSSSTSSTAAATASTSGSAITPPCFRIPRVYKWTIATCLDCPYTRKVHPSKPIDYRLELYCPFCALFDPSAKDKMEITTCEAVWECWICAEVNYFMEGNKDCENCGYERGSECVTTWVNIGYLGQEGGMVMLR